MKLKVRSIIFIIMTSEKQSTDALGFEPTDIGVWGQRSTSTTEDSIFNLSKIAPLSI